MKFTYCFVIKRKTPEVGVIDYDYRNILNDITQWCYKKFNENKCFVYSYNGTVWLEDKNDAMLLKLFWGGQLNILEKNI